MAGYNYGEKWYGVHHKEHPDWFIYGSETASVVQSRGIYHFPLSQSILSDEDLQCSALGNSSTSWGAESTEKVIVDDRAKIKDTPQLILITQTTNIFVSSIMQMSRAQQSSAAYFSPLMAD